MVKWIKRILLSAGLLLLAFITFLTASIVIDGWGTQRRLAAVSNTTIPGADAAPDVRAYVARPPGDGPFPAVIMIHEFYGLNPSIVGKAEGLADEGYLVVALDTFRGSTTSWIPRAIYQVITTPQAEINQDMDSVFTWLVEQADVLPGQIGTVGFCYGGRASLTYSLHNPRIAASVVFYGSPVTDPDALATLNGPVLGIFGGADRSIPLEQVAAFRAGLEAAGVPHEIRIYDGQPHAFVTDINAIRAGGVQAEAWSQMVDFLERYLKSGGVSSVSDAGSEYRAPLAWDYLLMLVFEHTFSSDSHQH